MLDSETNSFVGTLAKSVFSAKKRLAPTFKRNVETLGAGGPIMSEDAMSLGEPEAKRAKAAAAGGNQASMPVGPMTIPFSRIEL